MALIPKAMTKYTTQSYMPVVSLSGAGLTKPVNDLCIASWDVNTTGFVLCYDTTGLKEYAYIVVKTRYDVHYRQMGAL